MQNPLSKVFPIFGEIAQRNAEHEKVSDRGRKRNSNRPPKEEVLWGGNPLWVVDIGHYLTLLAIGFVITFLSWLGVIEATIGFAIEVVLTILSWLEVYIEPEPILRLTSLTMPVTWVILFLVGVLRFVQTKTTRYELTATRISFIRGLLIRPEKEAFLYKVTDHEHTPHLWQKPFGRSDMWISTSDGTFGERTFHWIADGYMLKRHLDILVHGESMRMPVGQLIHPDGADHQQEGF